MFRRRTALSGVLLPLLPACSATSPAPNPRDADADANAGGRGASSGGQAGTGDGAGGQPGGAGGRGGAGGTDDTAPAAIDGSMPPRSDTAVSSPNDVADVSTGDARADGGVVEPLVRIGFGSCNRLDFGQGFWPQILARKPQVFLFLGDAIYVDYGNTYAQLAANDGFKKLLAMARPFVTWDDHDFGGNNSGASFKEKAESKRRFLEFWAAHGAIPPASPRWTSAANYDAAIVGPPGKEVQIIMIDNRMDKGDPPSGKVLSVEQWGWLEGELKKPARLRLIMSGMQLLSTSPLLEGWGLYKSEQQRFFDLLKSTQAKGVVVLSGDKHYGEISRRNDLGIGYPLYDFTASPLNSLPQAVEPNQYRDGADAISDYNFGCITIDWSVADPTIHVELVHALKGTRLFERKLSIAALGG